MKTAVTFLLATCCIVGPACPMAVALDVATINEYAERSKAERPAALTAAKAELNRIRKNRRLKDDERKPAVSKLEQLVSDLENPLKPYFAVGRFNVETAKEGDIGRVTDATVDVFNVVERDNALIVAEWHQPYVPSVSRSLTETYDRIQRAAASPPRKKIPESVVWFKGPTSGFVDGKPTQVDGIVAVTGTKTYQSTIGTNTVPLFEVVDLNKYVDKFTRKSDVRTWTGRTGAHSTEAILVRTESGNVTLMTLKWQINKSGDS